MPEVSILKLCEAVHMCSRGSGNEPEGGLEAAVEELRRRIQEWMSPYSLCEYAVRARIMAAINDGEAGKRR